MGELDGLRRPLGRAGGAFLVGIFAFLAAALVFFTEATLSAAPIAAVSVQLAVTSFCCIVVYTSMSEAGVARGEEREEVKAARTELTELALRIRREGRIGGLAAFCRAYARREQSLRRAEILAEAGLDLAEWQRLLASPAALCAERPAVRRAVRRARRLGVPRLSPEQLMYGGERQRRALLPSSPVRVRTVATLRASIPVFFGSLVTVSVAFALRDGLDGAAIASAVFRLLALVSTAAKGYGMGYRSVVRDGVRNMECRAGYLARFLSEEDAGLSGSDRSSASA